MAWGLRCDLGHELRAAPLPRASMRVMASMQVLVVSYKPIS